MDLINANENFKKVSSEETRLRVTGEDLVFGVDYDRIDATYPTPTTEIFSYKLAGNEILKLEITYLTAAKRDFSSVVKI